MDQNTGTTRQLIEIMERQVIAIERQASAMELNAIAMKKFATILESQAPTGKCTSNKLYKFIYKKMRFLANMMD